MDLDCNARNNFLSVSLSVKLSHFFSYAKFVLAKHFVFSAYFYSQYADPFYDIVIVSILTRARLWDMGRLGQ